MSANNELHFMTAGRLLEQGYPDIAACEQEGEQRASRARADDKGVFDHRSYLEGTT